MSGYEHTAKYILEVSEERENYRRHAERLAQSINAFRLWSGFKNLGQYSTLRGTDEFIELCEAWRAFNDEHHTGLSNKVTDWKERKPTPKRVIMPKEGWK